MMREIVCKVISDERYRRNIDYGQPRPGHPEGSIRIHIADLETNLERLKAQLPRSDYYWRIKFLIHVHDTFKADAEPAVPIQHPASHASLARAFAGEFTEDPDLLAMIQFHDEGYALWRQFNNTGSYDRERFHHLLDCIVDWDLFLLFIIVDGCTRGKDRKPVEWFINEVRKVKSTSIDNSWLL